ncbi:hypothetical protein PENARI_c001G06308 [Penicillium arizonense]|uniref:Class II aldolase/adducin N-terminal domain-containing protein n=1 Tax=Penicillium arizonense TaxID=1835702 RepID=A0A1F5LYI6_PENAI|nr:hypothetical protein PENARI_c001G06308 [Penicillium arizonense]OGE58237.1 hypothetical protein PENARI_c001G06308 [Penicillium arizonense]
MSSVVTTIEPTSNTSALNTETGANGEVKRLHHIPRPVNKEAERKWLLEQMAGAFRIFAKLGFSDGSSGHISLRDPIEPRTFWINPYGVHFALLKVSDMVRVDEEGNRVAGADKPVNAAGFIIHSAIHQRRPDIHAACHMHSPYGRAWSTFGRGIDMFNQDSCMFYDDLSVYPAFGGVVFAKEEGQRLAEYLGPKNKNLIMQNHGLLTAGGTVAEAAAFFIALERACQTQLLVEASTAPGSIGASEGILKKTLVDDETAIYTKKGTGTPEVILDLSGLRPRTGGLHPRIDFILSRPIPSPEYTCERCLLSAYISMSCLNARNATRATSGNLICSAMRQLTLSTGPSSSSLVSLSPFTNPPRNIPRGGGPFTFLRHFANPSVHKDRLAIGETAKRSVRRNLETLNSHIEDALVPTDPLSAFGGDFQLPDFSYQFPLSTDDFFSQFPPEALFPSKLSNQLTEIMTELVGTSKSMCLGKPEGQPPLDFMELSTLLGVSNISASVSAFFHSLHWHLPVVHFPTFDPGNVSNSLLLSIFLSGATYTFPLDGGALPSSLFDVAEEYIFRNIANLAAVPSPKDSTHLLSTVQLIQSALIIEMLQFGRDDMQTRRRIRIVRHPCLVSTIRSLGIFQLKRRTAPKVCDEMTWKALVAEEVCIRIACWVFLADGFLTVCFKNNPSISVFEMDCHLPWSAGLWEAESASSFSKIAEAHSADLPLPPLRDVVTQLLETQNEVSIPWSLSVSVEHLLILIYAINSLAFQTRAGLLRYLSVDKIRRASANWKRIWDSVTGLLAKDQFFHIGYPKHAQELWWLLNATLEVSSKSDASFKYLDNTATDDLGNLNDFIQWCYEIAP